MKAFLILFLMLPSFQERKIPELSEGQTILAGKKPIEIKAGHLVPCAADWNGDGKPDLILGQFIGGRIRLYLNRGTDGEPLFEEFEFLKAAGEIISLPVG